MPLPSTPVPAGFDRASFVAFLKNGGGYLPEGLYDGGGGICIDNDCSVTAHPNAIVRLTAKHGVSGTDDAGIDMASTCGVLHFTKSLTWIGGQIDGNRDAQSINNGYRQYCQDYEAGTEPASQKAGIYVSASTAGRQVTVKDVVFRDCIQYGLYIDGVDVDARRITSGMIDNLSFYNCGATMKMDRCENVAVGSIYGYDLQNLLYTAGGYATHTFDEGYYYPMELAHGFQMLRCDGCSVELVEIQGMTGGGGSKGHLTGKGDHLNGITFAGNVGCPVTTMRVLGMAATGIWRTRTSILAISWVANASDCYITTAVAEGTATQGMEIISKENTYIDNLNLTSDGGRQSNSRTSGLNLHDGSRDNDDFDLRYSTYGTVFINDIQIKGQYHDGIHIRAGRLECNNADIRECRRHGVYSTNQPASYTGPSTADPVVILDNATIMLCGEEGILGNAADRIEVKAGRISDNCQRKNWRDPTTGATTYFSGDAGVRYAPSTGATVNDFIIDKDNVAMGSLYPTQTTVRGLSFCPMDDPAGNPVVGSEATIPEDRLRYVLVTFPDSMSKVPLGLCIKAKNIMRRADAHPHGDAPRDVNIIPVAVESHAMLAELVWQSKVDAGDWLPDGNRYAVPGRYSRSDGGNDIVAVTGPGDPSPDATVIEAPCFVMRGDKAMICLGVPDTDKFEVATTISWANQDGSDGHIDNYGFPDDFNDSGTTIYPTKIEADYTHYNRQAVAASNLAAVTGVYEYPGM